MGYKKKISTRLRNEVRKSKKSKTINVKLSGTQNKATISKKKISGSSNVNIRLNVAGGSGGGGSGGGGPSFPIPYNGVNGTIGDLIPYLKQIPTTQIPPVPPKSPPVGSPTSATKSPPGSPPGMTPVMPPNLKQEPIFNQPLPGEQFIPSGYQPYDYFANPYGPFIHSTTYQNIPRGHYPSEPYGKEAEFGNITETLEQYESFKLPPNDFMSPGTSGPSSLPLGEAEAKDESIYKAPVQPAWYPPEYQQPRSEAEAKEHQKTNSVAQAPIPMSPELTYQNSNFPSSPEEEVQYMNPLNSREARLAREREPSQRERLVNEEELRRVGELVKNNNLRRERELLQKQPIVFEEESNARVGQLQPLLTEPPIYPNQIVPYQIDMSQLDTPPSSPSRAEASITRSIKKEMIQQTNPTYFEDNPTELSLVPSGGGGGFPIGAGGGGGKQIYTKDFLGQVIPYDPDLNPLVKRTQHFKDRSYKKKQTKEDSL
jgi:hypothetical protein